MNTIYFSLVLLHWCIASLQFQKEQHSNSATLQRQLFCREHFKQLQLCKSSSLGEKRFVTDFDRKQPFSILYPKQSGLSKVVCCQARDKRPRRPRGAGGPTIYWGPHPIILRTFFFFGHQFQPLPRQNIF